MVEQHISIGAGKRECFPELLQDPTTCGIERNVEAQDAPAIMFHREEAIQGAEQRVATVKKSKAAITSRWLFRKASHWLALLSSGMGFSIRT